MDDVEAFLAKRRMQKWPSQWQELVRQLPAEEAQVLVELAALLDARPADEVVSSGRHDDPERESR